MCNGTAVWSATLSNCRSDGSPAKSGSNTVGSPTFASSPPEVHQRPRELRWDAGRDFRHVGTPSGSGAVDSVALALPEDRGALRVRRREQPRGGGLRNGGRTPAGGASPVSGLEKRQCHPRGPSCSGRSSPRRSGDRPPPRALRVRRAGLPGSALASGLSLPMRVVTMRW